MQAFPLGIYRLKRSHNILHLVYDSSHMAGRGQIVHFRHLTLGGEFKKWSMKTKEFACRTSLIATWMERPTHAILKAIGETIVYYGKKHKLRGVDIHRLRASLVRDPKVTSATVHHCLKVLETIQDQQERKERSRRNGSRLKARRHTVRGLPSKNRRTR